MRNGRAIHRAKRQSVPLPLIAMAGYTNAGKSTLFNRLTGSAVMADASMFATLDPTIRIFPLPSKRKALLSDTVGFISNLPADTGAGLPRDSGRSDPGFADSPCGGLLGGTCPGASRATFWRCWPRLAPADTPQLLVLNKADRLGPDREEAGATGAANSGPASRGGATLMSVAARW